MYLYACMYDGTFEQPGDSQAEWGDGRWIGGCNLTGGRQVEKQAGRQAGTIGISSKAWMGIRRGIVDVEAREQAC
jgi:hypothetical protein